MAPARDQVLSDRALNRALLARQHLLRREPLSLAAALTHLVGLQAQAPLPPYVGLWSRLEGFDPRALGAMVAERLAVRLVLMRGTIHLVTPRDARALRPLVQDAVARAHRGAYGRRTADVDPARLAAETRALLRDRALTAREVGAQLVARGLGADAEAAGDAAVAAVPLVQVPPRGVWGRSGPARYATLDDWVGTESAGDGSLDDLVVRYLAAFGPASVRDAQAWSGVTHLRAVFARLRPRLCTFRDARGVELFDLPDAPRPDPDVPAPVRFLGQFDNALLGHADRARILPVGGPQMIWSSRGAMGHVLVDGLRQAEWTADGAGHEATLAVRPFATWSAAAREPIEAEARRLLAFLKPESERRTVTFTN